MKCKIVNARTKGCFSAFFVENSKLDDFQQKVREKTNIRKTNQILSFQGKNLDEETFATLILQPDDGKREVILKEKSFSVLFETTQHTESMKVLYSEPVEVMALFLGSKTGILPGKHQFSFNNPFLNFEAQIGSYSIQENTKISTTQLEHPAHYKSCIQEFICRVCLKCKNDTRILKCLHPICLIAHCKLALSRKMQYALSANTPIAGKPQNSRLVQMSY